MPQIEAIDMRREGPPRGRFISPRLAEAVKIALERKRAGAAVPQSPRLCAADLVPRLRPSVRLPELRCLAGRSPLPAAAGVPSLRLTRCRRPQHARIARRRSRWSPVGPGVERLEEEAAGLFPGARILVLSSDLVTAIERMRAGARRHGGGPRRHHHRHATRRQGPSFPAAQSGRHRRRRSGPVPTATRARRSGRSSCCIRWSAAPAARRAAASAICRRISPSIP